MTDPTPAAPDPAGRAAAAWDEASRRERWAADRRVRVLAAPRSPDEARLMRHAARRRIERWWRPAAGWLGVVLVALVLALVTDAAGTGMLVWLATAGTVVQLAAGRWIRGRALRALRALDGGDHPAA